MTVNKYLMVDRASGVVASVLIGLPDPRPGHDYVQVGPALETVGVGFVREPDGSFALPPAPALPVEPTETVADLLAQIEALKAKVEALEPAVVP